MSKKSIVRFDPKKPEKQSSDFIAPIRDENGNVSLASLKNGKRSDFGLVTFSGRTVTSDDIFAKLVDSGIKITSLDDTLADLRAFVDQLGSFNIGNVLELVNCESLPCGFELKKTSFKAIASKSRGLP